jgi:hypothetical protein
MRKLMTLTRLAVALVLLAAVFQVPAVQSSECTEGQYRTQRIGNICGCEDGISTPRNMQQCIGGQWQTLYTFCGAPFCQNPPGEYSCQDQPGSCHTGGVGVCPAYCSCCY